MKTQKTKDMERLMTALDICRKFHADQVDKCGQPYWIHPFTVAIRGFTGYDSNISYAIVGLLHDILEDTNTTMGDLMTLIDLTDEEIEALRLLIHNDDVFYDEYIDSIIASKNRIAISVKLDDLLHNMNLSRFKEAGIKITTKDRRRRKKYQKAFDKLLLALNMG